jgi:hypothetical protein
MTIRTITMMAALAVAPAALQAQRPAGAGDARLQATLDAALEAGIPVSLLQNKIAEGKAKGVPMERIVAAVEARLSALTQARDAFEQARLGSTSEGELSVAADAVQAGVSQAALVEISQTAPQERRMVAIAVLADLVALGHMSEQAMLQVQAALSRGPEALANLRAEASARVQQRGGPGAGVQMEGGAGARVELGTSRRRN